MIAQGFEMKPTIIFEDNESTIKLINNGRRSSSRKTTHIDNKYFYIHGKIIDGKIKTSFKPTDEMWADGLWTLLQGNQFVLFRNQVLNANIVN